MTSKPRSQAEPAIVEIIDGAYLRLKFCVACGNDNQDELHHHHLIARSQGGSDEETNLITFCVECHGRLHGVKWCNNHRDLIRSGHDRVRAEGTRSGRPIGGRRVPANEEREVAAALLKGDRGMQKIARELSVGVSVVQRVKASLTSAGRAP
jgi:hypothetical protein